MRSANATDTHRWTYACLSPIEREVLVTFESYLGTVDRGQFHPRYRQLREVIRVPKTDLSIDRLAHWIAKRLILVTSTPVWGTDPLDLLYPIAA